ncbi:ABC transporter ATP-binding protein [Taklimakanibacter deserti]|uniref:ABC transporter ATP-binding protein n=1 Tax=Taklimakanibacter deserti TaxID=2267839 RepID=UPI000E650A8D
MSLPERRNIAVDIHKVSHHFDLEGEALPVLETIDLTVAPGEFIALLGPSGCGKSTLLRLLAGLEKPARGKIHADGRPISAPDCSRILAFQDPTLFPWRTVWKNVATGLEAQGILDEQRGRVDDALALVRLEDFASAYPHQLSGGMAQRVALARALVNEPKLLLLDEPFGKLDSFTRMAMQAELLSLWQRQAFTAILVTHDIEEALLLASRVILLSDRPARLVHEVRVDLDYPRRRDQPTIIKLRRQIAQELGLDDLAIVEDRVPS